MTDNNTPYSQLKIFHHPETLEHLQKGERCTPIYIRIKPTNKCDQDCYYCVYKHAFGDLEDYCPTDEIPYEKMMEIVEDIIDMGVKAVTFSGGGEPLLYPYIVEVMEKLLAGGVDLSMITNASMLYGKRAEILAKAKWVRISVESIQDSEYCRLRGIKEGAFERLCDNIKQFAAIKEDTCQLGVNMVVGKENYKEVRKMAELMKKLGVNHVKYAPLLSNATEKYHHEFKDKVSEELVRAQEELADDKFQIIDLYTKAFSNSVIFKRKYIRCPIKEFVCVIAANSKVYYCHDKAYLKNGVVGDLTHQSFKECWYSEMVTKQFKDFNAMRDCNQHCVYDGRNEIINAFLDIDKNHLNFV